MRLAFVLATLVGLLRAAHADDAVKPDPAAGETLTIKEKDDETFLLHHPDAKWWLSAQANSILQAQPGFASPYPKPIIRDPSPTVGQNSLDPNDHAQISFVTTVFAGYEITPTTTVIITGESAGGGGLSTALGLAGFTNLDVVRNPSLGAAPYVGRAFVDQIIPLDDEREDSERGPLRIFHKLPTRRLEFRAGKVSTADYFDVNGPGSDSHLQFMNWTVDNNGAYDYAADTRGYTLGGMVEYADKLFAVRYGLFLMPTVANGIDYDWALTKARGENLEVEVHDTLANRPGTIRLLGFWNHAKMGLYEDANKMAMPDVTATRVAGRVKYGFGINAEQEVAAGTRVFGRVGWNEGKAESFAYTEVDNTVLAGGDRVIGPGKLGIALVTNGISRSHREYLALGGKGFLLGDGRLNYSREDIFESYYTFKVYRGVFPAVDVQAIAHPGYNADRGPVIVGSLRLHLEI